MASLKDFGTEALSFEGSLLCILACYVSQQSYVIFLFECAVIIINQE